VSWAKVPDAFKKKIPVAVALVIVAPIVVDCAKEEEATAPIILGAYKLVIVALVRVALVAIKLVVVKLVKMAEIALIKLVKKLVVVADVNVACPELLSEAEVVSVQAEPFQNNSELVAVPEAILPEPLTACMIQLPGVQLAYPCTTGSVIVELDGIIVWAKLYVTIAENTIPCNNVFKVEFINILFSKIFARQKRVSYYSQKKLRRISFLFAFLI
jgi:hypothetical protein